MRIYWAGHTRTPSVPHKQKPQGGHPSRPGRPRPAPRRKTAEMHGFGEDMCFESAEALAERPRLADAVINGTMDTQHVKTAVPLLRRGYDMLLEKALRRQ